MTRAEKAAAYIVVLMVIYLTLAGVAFGVEGIIVALIVSFGLLLLWLIWRLIASIIEDHDG
jgi:hypothetical protein